MKKMLIAYYSWSNGNTKRVAEMLQRTTNADIVRIDTVTPYPDDYDLVVEQGQDEVESGYMPEIKPLVVNVCDYDIIAVGTPTWWYTMAPAVLTFLKENDFSGKTVVPFMTNGGWRGHVIKDIKTACTDAEFAPEIEVRFDSQGGNKLETPEKNISDWTERIRRLCE